MIKPQTRKEIDRFTTDLIARFTPPEYIPGCKVISVTDKDDYATDNGWIEAVCGQHNNQRCRWMGQVSDIAVNDYVDVFYYPSFKLFVVAGQGGTSAVKPAAGSGQWPGLNEYWVVSSAGIITRYASTTLTKAVLDALTTGDNLLLGIGTFTYTEAASTLPGLSSGPVYIKARGRYRSTISRTTTASPIISLGSASKTLFVESVLINSSQNASVLLATAGALNVTDVWLNNNSATNATVTLAGSGTLNAYYSLLRNQNGSGSGLADAGGGATLYGTTVIPTYSGSVTIYPNYLLANGTITGATSQAQDFGSNGIKADVIAESTGAAGVTIVNDLIRNSDSSTIHALEEKTNSNDIYLGNALSKSDFVSTIATLPGGASLTYGAVTSGDAANLVPVSTSQLSKLVLHNTTRGDSALISDCNTGTSTITLTASVPGTWATSDTITIRSQTNTSTPITNVYFVDLQFTSGLNSDTDYIVIGVVTNDSGGPVYSVYHPYESNVASKRKSMSVQVAGVNANATFIMPIISNTFCASWDATGTGTMLVLIRLNGEGRKTS